MTSYRLLLCVGFCLVFTAGCTVSPVQVYNEHYGILYQYNDYLLMIYDEESAAYFMDEIQKNLDDKLSEWDKRFNEKVGFGISTQESTSLVDALISENRMKEHEAFIEGQKNHRIRIGRLKAALEEESKQKNLNVVYIKLGAVVDWLNNKGPDFEQWKSKSPFDDPKYDDWFKKYLKEMKKYPERLERIKSRLTGGIPYPKRFVDCWQKSQNE